MKEDWLSNGDENSKTKEMLLSQFKCETAYGITDGKAVGTYLEQKFRLYLKQKYEFIDGNSASGIDFPGILVDVKVTSIRNRSRHVLSNLQGKRFLGWDIH